ncbi:hypothetical protein MUGA111182_16265 [Mucilaginibacter galii]|uniref:hypothetical protein n=1 Tax=Mucilaginibacter galii TaxID=2005073 RepID=UPI00166B35EB|nr:hypothetical protein [Mucilaginibacter galii]
MILLRRLLQVTLFTTGTILLPLAAFSQSLIPITGITYNNKTSGRVAQVTITNLQHPLVVFSNDVGSFSISAAPTDTLLFAKPGFTEQRLVVKEQQQILVYLVPALQLDEVQVKAKTRKQEQQDVLDVYRSKGLYYDGKPPALSFLASPLTSIYELFGKDASRMRRFASHMKVENQQTEVNKRYTVDLVRRITKLPDDEVRRFMLAYSPPYPEVLKWNDYEVIQFINRSMAGYNRAKSMPPLPKLTTPE